MASQFSRLPPYQDWTQLMGGSAASMELFIRPTFYRKTLRRVATRYINKFKFPGPIRRLNSMSIFSYMPVVPKVLPQILLNGFISQIVVPYANGTVRGRHFAAGCNLVHLERCRDSWISTYLERKFFADEEEAWESDCYLAGT